MSAPHAGRKTGDITPIGTDRWQTSQVGSVVQDEPNGDIVAAGKGTASAKRPNVFARIALFIRQVFAELRKVVTPSRQELIKFTLVVLGFVVVMMAIVYGLDFLFTLLANTVFGRPV